MSAEKKEEKTRKLQELQRGIKIIRVIAILILVAAIIVPHGVLHEEGTDLLLSFSVFFLMGISLLYLAS